MTPLRLLAIIEATSITGPARNLLEFARLATAQNVFTTIATFTRDESGNQFTRAVQAAMVSHPGIVLETIPERGPFDRENLRSLHSLVRRVNPDVIQTHAVKSHFLTRLSGAARCAPWVAFHHGYTWPTFRARAYNQLDRWSLRAAMQIITVSQPFRDELVELGVPPGRIEIVHNAIPADLGAEARQPAESERLRQEMGIPEGRKVVLIVGRLSREKDHLTLLEAVNRLRATVDPYLVIVGDGPEKPRIEERIRQSGMQNCVTLTGHQPSAEPWYGIASVAVLSSLSEGSPNALLEAMATGVPVVATAVGGVPEIVTNEESALLVAPRDPGGMSAALSRVLSDPALSSRLTQRSRELILERHEPQARTRKLVSIYRSLRDGSPASQS